MNSATLTGHVVVDQPDLDSSVHASIDPLSKAMSGHLKLDG